MPHSVIFDTHKFIKRLEESGFKEGQAEGISDAFKEAQQSTVGELTTKHDLKELELVLKHDLKELESELKHELSLLKWMMGFILAGIISLILKTFFV